MNLIQAFMRIKMASLDAEKKTKMETKQTGNKPIAKIESGQIKAAIWENEREIVNTENKKIKIKMYTIQIEKSYLDAESKDWKTTNSYHENELAKLKYVIEKSFDRIQELKAKHAAMPAAMPEKA